MMANPNEVRDLQVQAEAEVERLHSEGWTQEDFANALKEELLGTISGLEIQVGQLKDEVNNLQSRIERLENE